MTGDEHKRGRHPLFVIPLVFPYHFPMSGASRRLNLVYTGHIATVVVVCVAFIVTFVAYLADLRNSQGPPFSGTAMAVATLLGIVYLWLLVADPRDRMTATTTRATAVYFLFLIALMLAIEFLLAGANGIWLISMPLIATATTELPPRPRWLVYIVALFGVAMPTYLLYGNWYAPFFFVLTFITAMVFVIAFVKLTQASEQAQLDAEKLAEELADANTRLADYAIQAEELATIQERNRLAREIHDNLGHYLTVVNVQINAARAMLERDPSQADMALEKAARLTQDGLAAIRQSISALRESPLGRRTLPEAVAALASETQAAGIIAEFQVKGIARTLDPRTELTLFRAAQEGLTNVRKHARASRVDLTLNYDNITRVSLMVRDNGLGRNAATTTSGFGLLGLEERARQLGGCVAVETAPGAGYCLTVELPTETREPAAATQEPSE